MRQEKWDEFHKKLDDALESGFDTAKVALRRYLLENKEQVAADLDEMRKKSNHSAETLEEAAEEWAFETNGHKWSNNDGTAGDNYGSFMEGAKWQQERMYSEEEVLKLLEKSHFVEENIYEWFEKFKKK
jgi:hypothetical protein